MAIHVELQYAFRDKNIPGSSVIKSWVRAALCDLRKNAELTVRIVDKDEMAELNQRWRQASGTTNVLSFPATGTESIVPDLLGDIVICAPVVEKEAQQQNKSLTGHWAHMVIHGVLHLLGYDHNEENDAEIMENLEIQILAKLGIENPYI